MSCSQSSLVRAAWLAPMLAWAAAAPLSADVKLHGLFTDGMVLQRDAPAAVYGTAPDGEKVTVEIAGQKAEATARDGRWKATLQPMPAGGPHTLTVTGKNTITLKDVMLGDVWICTGQSNMAGLLGTYKSDAYKDHQALFQGIPGDKPEPMIRLFKVAKDAASEPQREVVTDKDFGASWRVCDSQSALLFSATGYLFGRALQPRIGVPIGLIYSTVGGTPAEAWTSQDALKSRPEFKDILDSFETAVKNHPKAYAEYEKRLQAWKEKRKTEGAKAGKAPNPPMGADNLKRPSGLYNFMIAPLQEFRIKGAIWYQGEGNSSRAIQYRTLFPAMITSWRQQWGQGDFPFLFVQLAAYRDVSAEPQDPDWAWLREAQTMTLALPNTGMAVAIEAGAQKNIHPPNKPAVGERLALAALKVAYGQDVVASGPTYKRMRVEGGRAVIEFDNVAGGLEARAVNLDGHQLAADVLKGFTICGADKKFKWAEAKIEGDTVVVSSPEVSQPVAVRYAWADFPLCNLYNKAGLPAGPFRTDDFPQGAAGKVAGIAVGKPFVCNQPITNGLYGGLTDGDLRDSNRTSFATNGALKFPKEVTVDLQGKYAVSAVRVHNSAFGGTKTVEVQVSGDGKVFKTLGKTEFKNYTPEVYELAGLAEKGVGFVRVVFLDIHELAFQHKVNGFVFLRELEVEGTPEP